MKINEWLDRCAAQYMKRAEVGEVQARLYALLVLASSDADATTQRLPEAHADNDMDEGVINVLKRD